MEGACQWLCSSFQFSQRFAHAQYCGAEGQDRYGIATWCAPALSKANQRCSKHQQHQEDVQRLIQGAPLQMEGKQDALHQKSRPQDPLRRKQLVWDGCRSSTAFVQSRSHTHLCLRGRPHPLPIQARCRKRPSSVHVCPGLGMSRLIKTQLMEHASHGQLAQGPPCRQQQVTGSHDDVEHQAAVYS